MPTRLKPMLPCPTGTQAAGDKSFYLVWLVRRAWNTPTASSAVSNTANTCSTRLLPHLGIESFTLGLEMGDTALERKDSEGS